MEKDLVKLFLDGGVYKHFEECALRDIKHWDVLMMDCLEGYLLDKGCRMELVRICVNAAYKKFQNDHKTEISYGK